MRLRRLRQFRSPWWLRAHGLLAVVPALLVAAPAQAQRGGRPPVTPPAAAKPDSAAAAGADSAAKVAARFASLTGTVYDSIHLMPLAQAAILVQGTQALAFTDKDGRFLVDSIPAGSHRVEVEHALLDTLGLRMITDPIEMTAGDTSTIAFSVPSIASVVGASCPPNQMALGPAAIIGRLLDADTDNPVAGARVSFAWSEISISAGVRQLPRVRESRSGDNGVFRICGLPSEVDGTLQAINKGVTTSEVRITLHGEPLAIQALKIGSANTVSRMSSDSIRQAAASGSRFSAPVVQRGDAVLNGKVVNANGSPITGARVDVIGTESHAQTNDKGEFTLTDLPSGTQSVVARQMGFSPVELPVELSTRGAASVTLTMAVPAQLLPTIEVKAEQDKGLDNIGFTERKAIGGGTFLNADEIMQRGPNLVTDVFRTIPGLRVVPVGIGLDDFMVVNNRASMISNSCVKFWVDGTPWTNVYPGDIDRLMPPSEVGAIEVYHGTNTPLQFQSSGDQNCAVVVMWSKYSLDRASRRKR